MNRIGRHCVRAMLLAVMMHSGVARHAGAQAPKYKVGDSIECNVAGKWQPGTIVQVQNKSDGDFYVVNNDGEAHTWDRWASADQVRRRTGVLSPTQMAQNAIKALGVLKKPNAGSLDETFQNLIRARWADQGSAAFPVTVTFQGMLIGKTHAYSRPGVDGESADGPGGTARTPVYPVSAQYYHRTAFRDAYLTDQRDDLYLCFKNSFSKWQCNLGSGKGTVNHFREERASYP